MTKNSTVAGSASSLIDFILTGKFVVSNLESDPHSTSGLKDSKLNVI
jgi:hypothetical protein